MRNIWFAVLALCFVFILWTMLPQSNSAKYKVANPDVGAPQHQIDAGIQKEASAK
jgi:hypothetical protein